MMHAQPPRRRIAASRRTPAAGKNAKLVARVFPKRAGGRCAAMPTDKKPLSPASAGEESEQRPLSVVPPMKKCPEPHPLRHHTWHAAAAASGRERREALAQAPGPRSQGKYKSHWRATRCWAEAAGKGGVEKRGERHGRWSCKRPRAPPRTPARRTTRRGPGHWESDYQCATTRPSRGVERTKEKAAPSSRRRLAGPGRDHRRETPPARSAV